MQVMGGIPINVQPPGGSGGGSTIPTIAADVTYNVPTNYPTIAAALAYVQSAVRLNGAIVTINVESALLPVLNEQIILDEVELHYVRLTNDGPVAVNSTGFTNSVLGIPAWIYLTHAALGEITGTWTKGAGGVCIGILTVDGYANAGIISPAPVTCSITGFFYDVFLNAGTLTSVFTTVDSIVVAGNATAELYSSTTNGSVTAQNEARFNSTLGTHNTVGGANNISANTGGEVVLNSCTLNSGTNNIFLFADNTGNIRGESITVNITANNPALASAAGASNINLNNVTVVGVSASARFTVAEASMIQAANIGAGFGADSQAALAVLATGLIIA